MVSTTTKKYPSARLALLRFRKSEKRFVVVSPLLIIGAVAILVPVFIFMTMDAINRQKEQTARLLVEKGEAIIRSFEAGVRTGGGMHWGGFQLQKLLMETAEQSDIDYLIVTDANGMILADSDPLRIGTVYDAGLDLGKTAVSKTLSWRLIANNQGGDTFEVYRGLSPTAAAGYEFAHPFGKSFALSEKRTPSPPGLVVFAGLDMAPIEEARKQDISRTVWSAVLFLLIGLAGIVSLMLAHGYQAARSSLARIRVFSDSLVENMPIGLVAVDAGGILTACNRAAENILRLGPGEYLGRQAADVVPLELNEFIMPGDRASLPFDKEVICTTSEGATMTLEVVAAPLFEQAESFLGIIVLFRDMTDIKRLEDEVERGRRLASLGGLAAGVAHEIRNPLSSIKGFATHFRERFSDVPEEREAAEVMIREVDRINRVITQLIEFARPLKMKIVSVSLPVVIRHALALIEREAAKRGVVVQTDIPEGKWEVPIDVDRMTQVFLNLFLNALEAMEEGGTLRVTLFQQEEKALRITVADTGIGIPEADLLRVFDPYFTTRSAGTGLGLAICHKIVEAHRGEIFMESEPGKGTTVTLLLPVTDS